MLSLGMAPTEHDLQQLRRLNRIAALAVLGLFLLVVFNEARGAAQSAVLGRPAAVWLLLAVVALAVSGALTLTGELTHRRLASDVFERASQVEAVAQRLVDARQDPEDDFGLRDISGDLLREADRLNAAGHEDLAARLYHAYDVMTADAG